MSHYRDTSCILFAPAHMLNAQMRQSSGPFKVFQWGRYLASFSGMSFSLSISNIRPWSKQLIIRRCSPLPTSFVSAVVKTLTGFAA